jgi:archaellum component FlaG (FlaF/FlaG flagellin family)
MKVFKCFIAALILFFIAGIAQAGDVVDTNADSFAGASVTIDDHSENTSNVYDRKFANPGLTPLPGTQAFLSVPTQDSSFRSVKDLIEMIGGPGAVCIKLSEGALINLAKGGDVESHLQIIRGPDMVTRASNKGARWIWLAYQKPVTEDGVVRAMQPVNMTVTGAIDGEADDGDTNSFQVLGKMGLKALKDGNNVMVISAEDAHRKIEASGWGIGTYTVLAGNMDNGKIAGGGGGGTGYASNETGPEDRPWAQGYVGMLIGTWLEMN